MSRPTRMFEPGGAMNAVQAMIAVRERQIAFVRLTEISVDEIVCHMCDPRIAAHLPLLTYGWDRDMALKFVSAKEERWRRDGLGHWAILCDGRYAGWGGFQLEGDEWDFGLVLRPEYFGAGIRITRKAIAFARSTQRIGFVTFLLPPSRRHLGAIERAGAVYVGDVDFEGARFRKYRIETTSA